MIPVKAWNEAQIRTIRAQRTLGITKSAQYAGDITRDKVDISGYIPAEWISYMRSVVDGGNKDQQKYSKIDVRYSPTSDYYMHFKTAEERGFSMELKLLSIKVPNIDYTFVRNTLSNMLEGMFGVNNCIKTVNTTRDLVIGVLNGCYWMADMQNIRESATMRLYRCGKYSNMMQHVPADSKDAVGRRISEIGMWARIRGRISCMEPMQSPGMELAESACICSRCNKIILF